MRHHRLPVGKSQEKKPRAECGSVASCDAGRAPRENPQPNNSRGTGQRHAAFDHFSIALCQSPIAEALPLMPVKRGCTAFVQSFLTPLPVKEKDEEGWTENREVLSQVSMIYLLLKRLTESICQQPLSFSPLLPLALLCSR